MSGAGRCLVFRVVAQPRRCWRSHPLDIKVVATACEEDLLRSGSWLKPCVSHDQGGAGLAGMSPAAIAWVSLVKANNVVIAQHLR